MTTELAVETFAPGQLGWLLAELRKRNPKIVVPDGFHNPHSYRGDYSELAFEPAQDVTIGDMLAAAEEAVGHTYEGWKGGDYTMTLHTYTHLASEGDGEGETLGPTLLRLMLERGRRPEMEFDNRQLVGVTTGGLVTIGAPKLQMSYDEALCQAAWLVALADAPGQVMYSFDEYLEAVQDS